MNACKTSKKDRKANRVKGEKCEDDISLGGLSDEN